MASVPTAVPASILEVLGAWASRQSQTVPQRLVDAEKILEVLDTASLFDALMLSCPFRDRKNLSYLGGIRCSVEDVGSPAPYAGTEVYLCLSGDRLALRDPVIYILNHARNCEMLFQGQKM